MIHPDIAAVLAGERRWCVVCADALDVLPTLPEGVIGACVTDPPYGMNNDNNYARFTEGPHGHGAATSRHYPPTIGDNKPFDPAPWLAFDRVVLWGANHFGQRLPVGTTLVWLKRFDGGFGTFLSDAEVGWMRDGHGVYCHRNTSMYSNPQKRQHPNEKPVGLMKWCLEQAKVPRDAVVLDPYCGSGTTGIACLLTGRRFIGVEIDENYCSIATKRLSECDEVPPLVAASQGLFDAIAEGTP